MKITRTTLIGLTLPLSAAVAQAQTGMPLNEFVPIQDVLDGAVVDFIPPEEDPTPGVPDFSFDDAIETAPITIEEALAAQSALAVPFVPEPYVKSEKPDLYGLRIGRALWSKAQGKDKFVYTGAVMGMSQEMVDYMNDYHTAKSMAGAGIFSVHKWRRLNSVGDAAVRGRIGFDGEGALNVLGYEISNAVRFDATAEVRRGEFVEGTYYDVESWESYHADLEREASFHVELKGLTVVDKYQPSHEGGWLKGSDQMEVLDVTYPTSFGPVEVELNFQGGAECGGRMMACPSDVDNIPGVGAAAEVDWNVYANGGLEIFPLGGWDILSLEFKLELDILGDSIDSKAKSEAYEMWGMIEVSEESLRARFKVILDFFGFTSSKTIFDWGTGSDSETVQLEQLVGS